MELFKEGKKIFDWTFVGKTLTVVACVGAGIYLFRKMPKGREEPPGEQTDGQSEENGIQSISISTGKESGYYSSGSPSLSSRCSENDDSEEEKESNADTHKAVVTFDTDEPRRIRRPKVTSTTLPNRRRRSLEIQNGCPYRPPIRAVFSGTFTHEKGGVLIKEGSDVKLIIPPGAVPKGRVYTINGKIHTNINEYSQYLEQDKEHVIAAIPEYEVQCGGSFDKPVEVVIPHCLNVDSKEKITVRYGSEEDLREISDDNEDVRYAVQDKAVHIWTNHFTKFVVSANVCESYGVTDAMLTVAVQKKDLSTKRVIQLRVMLHSRCPDQSDFSAERSQYQYYDPGMIELKRMKVDLPDKGGRPYPKIVVKLTIDEDTGWKNRLINGEPMQSLVQEKDGQDVLAPRYSNLVHRSEQLADFSVEKSDSDDPVPLSCRINVDFHYGKDLHKPHVIDVDYPTLTPTRRKSSVMVPPLDAFSSEVDPLSEVFRTIAKPIGNDFGELAVHLGMPEHDRNEIERNNPKIFDRNYELLNRWRKGSSGSATIADLVQALKECNRKDLEDMAEMAFNLNSHSSPTGNMRRRLSASKPVLPQYVAKIREDDSQDED